jgi:hypothetical protein
MFYSFWCCCTNKVLINRSQPNKLFAYYKAQAYLFTEVLANYSSLIFSNMKSGQIVDCTPKPSTGDGKYLNWNTMIWPLGLYWP